MWERARSGAMPGQHVWGVDALAERGHTVVFAPFHEPSHANRLDHLSRRGLGLLGHLDQEAYAARRIRGLDALYCADQMGLSGLALIRCVLPSTRFISVVHHPAGHAARQAALARHDALVCLSPAIAGELERALPRPRPRIVHLPWGPDLASPLYRSGGGPMASSAPASPTGTWRPWPAPSPAPARPASYTTSSAGSRVRLTMPSAWSTPASPTALTRTLRTDTCPRARSPRPRRHRSLPFPCSIRAT